MTRFDAWDVGPPPSKIVDRVMEGVAREERRRKGQRALAAGVMAAVACAASVLGTVWSTERPNLGDVVANERMEVEIAPGVLAVMERAAHLAWRGREILQDRGEVSYRVKAGVAFDVSTPTARMTGGASTSRVLVEQASTYVAVRDGEVSLARGAEQVSLGAGRYARVDLVSLKTDRDDVDGSIGRYLGLAVREPTVEPARPTDPTTSSSGAPKAAVSAPRVSRPSASVSAAPSASAPPPPKKPPIVPPCFCNPVQAVCDCGGG